MLLDKTYKALLKRYHAQEQGGREVDNLGQARRTSFPLQGVVSVALPAINKSGTGAKAALLSGAAYRLT